MIIRKFISQYLLMTAALVTVSGCGIKITVPPDDSSFAQGDTIRLKGTRRLGAPSAYDFKWSSSIDGSLGTGDEIFVPDASVGRGPLSEGEHNIAAKHPGFFSWFNWVDRIALTVTPADCPPPTSFTAQNISNTTGTSGDPDISTSQKNVHVVWTESVTPTNQEILYTVSTDNGATWSSPRNLSNSTQNEQSPDIAVDGDNIHVVWTDLSAGNWEILYTMSTNNGVTWSSPQNISHSPTRPEMPKVAVDGNNVHVVWDDNNPAPTEILYAKSTDSGAHWSSPRNISSTSEISESQSIGVDGNNIHVVWRDPNPGNWEILYTKSTDNGATWSSPQNISNTLASSGTTAIAVEGSNLKVVWADAEPGNWEILYTRSSDNGATWSSPQNISGSADTSILADIAVHGSKAQILWSESPPGDWDIMYTKSTDDGVSWSSPSNIDNVTSHPLPAIALNKCHGHIVWKKEVSGNFEIYYLKNSAH